MKTRKIKCYGCKEFFFKEEKKIRWNKKIKNKNYCSIECVGKHRLKRKLLNCACCNKLIERTPSQLRNESGKYYCSKTCAVTINNSVHKQGKNSPNYKDGKGSYRKKALKYYDNKCSVCNYNVVRVLEIHHIDGNRNNNKLKNLQVLCPTHHKEYTYGIRV